MPSNLASSGIAPAFFTANARHSSPSGIATGFTLRRIDVSAASVTISHHFAGSRSAVRAAETSATTRVAISALTRVDMSGGRATNCSASTGLLAATAALSGLGAFALGVRTVQIAQSGDALTTG